MDFRQCDLLEIVKLPYGGYAVSAHPRADFSGVKTQVYASVELSDCFKMIEKLITFDEQQKGE